MTVSNWIPTAPFSPPPGVRYQPISRIISWLLCTGCSSEHQPNSGDSPRRHAGVRVLREEPWRHALVCPHLQEVTGGRGCQTLLSDSVLRGALPRQRPGSQRPQAEEVRLQEWGKVKINKCCPVFRCKLWHALDVRNMSVRRLALSLPKLFLFCTLILVYLGACP